jgi:glycosyl transferase family 2
VSGLDDVDLVFLAWREGPAMLARFHAAAARTVAPGWAGRVVLVENAAPPATSRAARELIAASYPDADRIVLRSERNLGFGRAMDLGLAACRGTYAALMNSDGRPEPDMLEGLHAALEADPAATWAAPGVHGPGEPDHPPGPVHEEEELPGMALLVRREAFLALGGFDPLFYFYSEDFDASRRIRAAGQKLIRVPGVRFHHGKGGRSRRGAALREGLYALSDQALVHRHAPSAAAATRRVARGRARALAEHARDGDWPGLAGIAAATLAWPASAVLAARRRRRPWDGAQLEAWLERHRIAPERI